MNASGTWHHGLIARYWAEFNEPEPDELAWYRAAIERFGEPALDLCCGTGRLLLPLRAAGLDVDGVDISPDMLALCAARAERERLTIRLAGQAMDELNLGRTYRTIYICDSFGIGGSRDRDRAALRRIHDHLAPGGALAFSIGLPYDGADEDRWARWLPRGRAGIPREWPASGDRRRAANGDEFELVTRLAALDPIGQRQRLEMRARLFRDGDLVAEEVGSLDESLYFPQEVLLMLEAAGFGEIAMEGRYTARPATADDTTLVFVARRP